MSHDSLIQRPLEQASFQGRTLGWALSMTIRPIAIHATRSKLAMLGLRRLFNATGAVLSQTPEAVDITPVRDAQVRGEWLCHADAVGARQVVLYLHGGGYFFGSAAMHRQVTWRLSRALRRPVLAVDYRLAPRHTFEHWRDDAVQAYEHLLARGYHGQDIIISGDSAGGHLTLVLLQTLRDRGLPLPSAGICLSPWTDLTGDSPSITRNAERDPMIPAITLRLLSRYLCQGRDPVDPLVSPLHGSFAGLPPLYVMVGSTEVLRDDARRLAQRAHEAGVPVQYEEWHRMPHVFPLFAAVLPEGRRAFRRMADFVAALEAVQARLVA